MDITAHFLLSGNNGRRQMSSRVMLQCRLSLHTVRFSIASCRSSTCTTHHSHTITTTENKLIIYNNNIESTAIETLGVFSASAIRLLNDLGRRISSPERLVICISEFRCWCSASMLFCYTTACRSPTARTEHHTLSVIFIDF